MNRGIFVTGTDTGVGKTVVAAGLALGMQQQGFKVGIMKPVQTGAVSKAGRPHSADAEFLQKALESVEAAKDDHQEAATRCACSASRCACFPFNPHTPYLLKEPLAPLVAAQLEGVSIEPSLILEAGLYLQQRYSFLVVEGAGGVLVPVAQNYLMIDLIKDLGFPVVLVARASLGTINHTLLTLEALRNRGIMIAGVVLNQATSPGTSVPGTSVPGTPVSGAPDTGADLCEKTNPQVIRDFGQVDLLGVMPYSPSINSEKGEVGNLGELVQKHLNLESISGLPSRSSTRPSSTRPSSPQPSSPQPSSLQSSSRLKEWDKKYLWHPFTQMQDWTREDPLVVERGQGVYLEDTDGRKYIDGVASLWTNVHGHQKREIDEAIRDQLTRIGHSTMLGLTHAPGIELARRLVQIAPARLKRVFYSDNGATACEIALKMSFQYWQQQGQKKRKSFVYFENSYHGDTLGAVSVGGIEQFHRLYYPLLFHGYRSTSPYCYRCPYQGDPSSGHAFTGDYSTGDYSTGDDSSGHARSCHLRCLEDLEHIFQDRAGEISALIIEPCVQGAGGLLVAPAGFLGGVRDLCTKYGVLMIADEVAVGFGRTGRMFACEHENVHPDLLCLAKGITGGYLPLAATLTTEEVYAGFLGDYSQGKTFFHGHTYTGNPLACRAALASLDIFEKERVIENLPGKIEIFTRKLQEFWALPHVGDIRQKGLLAGIELVQDKATKEPYAWEEKIGIRVIQESLKMGVILRPLGNVIVLMPPLSISAAELDQLLSVTLSAIRQVTQGGEQDEVRKKKGASRLEKRPFSV